MLQIHQKIKQARVSKGLNQEEMAKKLGIERSTYQYWEQKTPSIDKIKRVQKVLNLPDDYFFVINDEVSKDHELGSNEKSSKGYFISYEERIAELEDDKKTLKESIQISLNAILQSQSNSEKSVLGIGEKQFEIVALIKSGLSDLAEVKARIEGKEFQKVLEETNIKTGAFYKTLKKKGMGAGKKDN